MFADELQPLLARLVAACRNASVQASSPRPHDLQKLDIFRLGPIAEARLGLALAASTKLLGVQAMADLCARPIQYICAAASILGLGGQ